MGCGGSTQNQEVVNNNAPRHKPENTTNEGKNVIPSDSAPVADQFVQDCVNKHNELRAFHSSPPMTVAQDLTDYAQKWADCLAMRDTMVHSDAKLPSGERIGENLYCAWSSNPSAGVKAEDAVQSWYDEIKDYDFNNGTFSMKTGHFTQVVWRESVELGVAFAQSSYGTWYVVANYRPAGNMMGDFSNNVLPPLSF